MNDVPINRETGMVVWPPDPTWENAIRIVRGALRWWERWCPDDGRPAEALRLATEYGATGEGRRTPELRQVCEGVNESVAMADRAVETHPTKGTRMWATQPGVACFAAAAVQYFVASVAFPEGETRTQLWRKAIEAAGSANLWGFIVYPLDDEDEDESEETA